MAQATSQEGPELVVDAHVKYVQSLDTRKDELDYWLTEHLRLNGLYWGLNALYLLRRPDALPRQDVIDFILSCQHESGGFGAAPGHDAHMLSTVSAVQILAMTDAFDQLETKGKGNGKDQVGKCRYFERPVVLPMHPLTTHSHRRPTEPRDWHICWR
jgi:geranylgeranyl transferase type-2 subunit beta